jgi:hypothetical protein
MAINAIYLAVHLAIHLCLFLSCRSGHRRWRRLSFTFHVRLCLANALGRYARGLLWPIRR